MVKKITPFIAYLVFFILALIYFTPKINIYYLIETQLEQNFIIISSEDVDDTGTSLVLQNAKITFKSIPSADIGSVEMRVYGIYNSLYLNDISLSSTAKSFMPLHVDNIIIIYSIFNPLYVRAHGVGEFGEFNAKFNILERTLHVELTPENIMKREYKNTLRNFTTNKDGELCYDKNF